MGTGIVPTSQSWVDTSQRREELGAVPSTSLVLPEARSPSEASAFMQKHQGTPPSPVISAPLRLTNVGAEFRKGK